MEVLILYNQMPYYSSPVMQNAQQRLQMMESQYQNNQNMNYPQPPNYMNNQQSASPILKGRPVSNEEEANAAMIDFDGSLFVFPDKAHGKIYTKQLGLDGNIIFLRYSLDPIKASPTSEDTPSTDMSKYVKIDYLNKKMDEIQKKFNALDKRIPNSALYSKKEDDK